MALDSYTALRPPRSATVDIVKAEHKDMECLDEVAKQNDCGIVLGHHNSKGSAKHDWASQAGGTYAMTTATECQIQISRFSELDTNAPERLIRVRGRHQEGVDVLLRFRVDTLDYEHVMEGAGAALYPLIQQLEDVFRKEIFGPKGLTERLGISRSTASRDLAKLVRAGVVQKRGFGDYVLCSKAI